MKCQEPRSYIVTTDRGDFRRTRNHIKVTEEQIGLGFSSGMDYGASSVGRASVAQPGNIPMPTNSAQSPAQPKPTNTPAKPLSLSLSLSLSLPHPPSFPTHHFSPYLPPFPLLFIFNSYPLFFSTTPILTKYIIFNA